ncbi:MAG: AsmA family protein [Pseudomonadota bacterium]
MRILALLVFVGLLAALVIVPNFLDWNRYRAPLAGHLESLFGGEIDLRGGVTLRTLPTPRLQVTDVRWQTPTGQDVHIGQIMAETGLFSLAQARVNQITISGMTVDQGLTLQAAQKALGVVARFSPERVSLNKGAGVLLPMGEEIVFDEIYGQFVQGQSGAPSQFIGRALAMGRPFEVDISWQDRGLGRGQDIRAKLASGGVDNEIKFDGTMSNAGNLRGSLTARGFSFRNLISMMNQTPSWFVDQPYFVTGGLAVGPDTVRYAVEDGALGRTRLTGEVVLARESLAVRDIKIDGQQFDVRDVLSPQGLAELTGQESRLGILGQVWLALPRSTEGFNVSLTAESLIMPEVTYAPLALEAHAAGDRLLLKTLDLTMPDRTQIKAQGDLSVTSDQVMASHLMIDILSEDVHQIAQFFGIRNWFDWVRPGSRGHLQGAMTLDDREFHLQQGTLNIGPLRAQGSVRTGLAPGTPLVIEATIDPINGIDFAPQDQAPQAQSQLEVLQGLQEALAQTLMTAHRQPIDLKITSPALRMSALTWRDVRADLRLDPQAWQINTLTVNDWDGVAVVMSGQQDRQTGAFAGTISGSGADLSRLQTALRILPQIKTSALGEGQFTVRVTHEQNANPQVAWRSIFEGLDLSADVSVSPTVMAPQALFGSVRLVSADASALGRAVPWLSGLPPVMVDAVAQLDYTPERISLEGLTAQIGAAGVAGRGVITIADGDAQAAVSVQVDEVDIPVLAAAGHTLWQALPEVTPRAARWTGDLSLNASRASLAAVTFDQPAMALRFDPQQIEIQALTSTLWGGNFGSELTFSAGDTLTPARLAGKIRLAGVNAQPLIELVAGTTAIDGQADMEVDINLEGDQDLSETFDTIAARGRLTVREGTLRGVNFSSLARKLVTARQSSDVNEAIETGMGGGNTDFTVLNVPFDSQLGIVRSQDLRFETANVSLQGRGQFALTSRELEALLQATFLDFDDAPPLEMKLSGTTTEPQVDTQSGRLILYMTDSFLDDTSPQS